MHFIPSTIVLAASIFGVSQAAPGFLLQRAGGIYCGGEGAKDAKLDDCKALIDKIDTSKQPSKCDNVKVLGPSSQACIWYQSGSCYLSSPITVNVNGPGGVGGGTSQPHPVSRT